jgi:hypothetical protein
VAVLTLLNEEASPKEKIEEYNKYLSNTLKNNIINIPYVIRIFKGGLKFFERVENTFKLLFNLNLRPEVKSIKNLSLSLIFY